MQNEINTITQQLFQKDSLEKLTEEDIGYFISKYPYVAPTRFLLAKKKHDANAPQPGAEVITAGLYFNNPLWLNSQLENKEPEEVTQAPALPEQPKVEEESPIAFQSYHTIDYFASQGIRLQQAELSKTAWAATEKFH